MKTWSKIEEAIKSRIVILDGAMGTMLQKQQLSEQDFRGERFKDWPSPLKGNNDLLVLTKPEAVAKVHNQFLEAGADLIETNSFNATTISQADYDMSELASEIARASAKVARECADKWTAKTPDKPRAVLGSIGPMNKTLSISPKVEDPGFRDVTFDEVCESYRGQVRAQIDIVDAILIETVFDTALGADEMRPHIKALSKVADTHILAFPNAGLPNAFGEYDETPDDMSNQIAPWVEGNLVNILGGCCGTSPDHIRAIADMAANSSPRSVPTIEPTLRLSGLEPFQIAI